METDNGQHRYEDVGGGVLLSSKAVMQKEVILNGRTYRRFMDFLLLPAPTEKLEVDAVVAINRWREIFLAKEGLPYRNLVRRMAIVALGVADTKGLIEIGCGKFPLVSETSLRSYMCHDIDHEAISYCRSLGLKATTDLSEVIDVAGEFDAFASLFTFQFSMSPAVPQLLQALEPGAVLIFNVPTQDKGLLGQRLQMIAASGFEYDSLNMVGYGANDHFVIASRPSRSDVRKLMLESAERSLNMAREEDV